jgi:multidrug efflux pump subunit AcrB
MSQKKLPIAALIIVILLVGQFNSIRRPLIILRRPLRYSSSVMPGTFAGSQNTGTPEPTEPRVGVPAFEE